MKVALVGASSFLGLRLFTRLDSQLDIIGTYFQHQKSPKMRYLNICNKNEIMAFMKHFQPKVILWVAGNKNLTITEKDIHYTQNINTIPISSLLTAISTIENYQPRIIFFSTDYVFDGFKGNYRHNDTPNPQTNYGKSNKQAEDLLVNHYDDYVILRTSAVMGKGGTFFDFLVNGILQHKSLELFDDCVFSPTPIELLVKYVIEILHKPHIKGIVHICGVNAYSRYGFGIMIKALLSKNHTNLANIIPISSNNTQRLFFPNLSLVSSMPFDDFMSEML